MKFKEMSLRAHSLVVFDGLLQDPVVAALVPMVDLLSQMESFIAKDKAPAPGMEEAAVAAYGAFTSTLFEACALPDPAEEMSPAEEKNPKVRRIDLAAYLQEAVLEDENYYVLLRARQEKAPSEMEDAVQGELDLFQAMCQLTSQDVKDVFDTLLAPEDIDPIGFHAETEEDSVSGAGDNDSPALTTFLPDWINSEVDLPSAYEARMAEVHKTGFGIFAKFRAFMVGEEGLIPVSHPDNTTLDQLFGYERERDLVIRNTEALLAGRGSNNLLLYGDAGTGKSSTIKAVANHFAPEGLRIIELRKEQLFAIPDLIEALHSVPLKFIIYIDDLSFSRTDENFSALKAILEGSITDTGDNIVVYATSNRRHLVRESMSDREGDDLHVNDTLQEMSSLAARFGLTITYQTPDKEEYLAIVDELAKIYGLEDLDPEELHAAAEQHALRINGRTPRGAKQFIELVVSGLAMESERAEGQPPVESEKAEEQPPKES